MKHLTTMKRTLLLFCLAAFSALPAAAVTWFLGFEGGYAYNDYSVNTQYAYDMRYTGANAFSIGVPVQLDILDWLGVHMDLQYVQKNNKMYRTHSYDGIYTDTQNHYLQVPVLVNFSFGGDRVCGYASVGGYMGCWLASHRKGVAMTTTAPSVTLGGALYRFDEYRELEANHDNRFDAGAAGNLGIRVKIDERMVFFAEGTLYYGLVSTEKTRNLVSPTPRYNTTYALQVGLLFALDRQAYINHKTSNKK